MKTKNILKIGVLSIILLSLLISPILKSDIFQAKAEEMTCQEASGICQNDRVKCKNGYEEADPLLKLKCPSGGGPKCCVLSDSTYVKPPSSDRAKYVEENSIKDATGTAKESSAAKICNILIYKTENPSTSLLTDIQGAWNLLTGSADDRWWSHKVCVFQIGALEGIGKMIAGMINSLTAQITWALNPDTYGGFVTNVGVVKIWNILKNFMNLALVLILIIIAISTILGIKKYRWQEILWKLVLIALLINFSLILPGILLDISHFITYSFINLTQNLNNDGSIAETIMNLYRTDEISGTEKYSASYGDTLGTIEVEGETIKMEKEGWGLAWGNFFLVLAALSLIGLFAFISLIAIFFTMMFRSFIIIILLAVSPIAFAAWVLPNTEKFWQLWWGQFTRWCLFPVTFAISLYAGIVVLNGMHDSLAKMGASNDKLGIIAMIVQIILFSMFLIGGLIVSIQSSGAVGKVVQKQVSRAGWLAGVFAAKRTTEAITESSTYKKAGQALTHIPLLKGVGQEMMLTGEKGRMARVKGHEKNFENVGLSTLKQLEETSLPSPLERQAYEQRIALTSKLAEMGQLGNNSIQFIKQNINDGRFDAKAITEALPHYFNIGEDKQLAETGDKISDKVKALSRIKPDKLRDKTQTSDFVKNIMRDKKAIAAKEGKTETEQNAIEQEAFEKTIQEIAKTLSPAQLAGVWKGISPKDMVEGQWGGPAGKMVQAIEKDPEAKNKFYNEAIPTSQLLREASGIKPKEKEVKTKTKPRNKSGGSLKNTSGDNSSPGFTQQGKIIIPGSSYTARDSSEPGVGLGVYDTLSAKKITKGLESGVFPIKVKVKRSEQSGGNIESGWEIVNIVDRGEDVIVKVLNKKLKKEKWVHLNKLQEWNK